MAGVLKYISAHMEIQYEGETDEQFRKRSAAMQAWNEEAERIEKAWAPSPMKGLKAGWDCGCWFSCTFRGGEQHPFCPRRESSGC